jgi:hypothetical protein
MPVIVPVAPALDVTVVNAGIDASHQDYAIIAAGNVLGGIGHGVSAAELLEANQVLEPGAQCKE